MYGVHSMQLPDTLLTTELQELAHDWKAYDAAAYGGTAQEPTSQGGSDGATTVSLFQDQPDDE